MMLWAACPKPGPETRCTAF